MLNFINNLFILNPKMKTPNLMYVPISGMLELFPRYEPRTSECYKYSVMGTYGEIEVKESPDNKIHLKYRKQ